MAGKPIAWLVATECPPERDAEFNEWYNNTHVPMVLKAPGVIGATRYKALTPTTAQPTSLAIYEVENEAALKRIQESPEMAAAKADKLAVWGESGFTVARREYYKPIDK